MLSPVVAPHNPSNCTHTPQVGVDGPQVCVCDSLLAERQHTTTTRMWSVSKEQPCRRKGHLSKGIEQQNNRGSAPNWRAVCVHQSIEPHPRDSELLCALTEGHMASHHHAESAVHWAKAHRSHHTHSQPQVPSHMSQNGHLWLCGGVGVLACVGLRQCLLEV